LTKAARILALALMSVPTATGAQHTSSRPVSYCSDLKRVEELATTKERFASIAGKPREGHFVDTSLALAGWKDCSLYGAGTYTCDSPALDNTADVEKAQAEILQQIKACLGGAWSEAADRSSPGYVVLHASRQPVSITLSWDQTADGKHVVRLILFVRGTR
jgi:hypothetical protein